MDIVLTIKPNHLRNIRIGKKKWELRKTKPKQIDDFDVPIRVYCCESGSGGNILESSYVITYRLYGTL